MNEGRTLQLPRNFPTIVCLCGSTRFGKLFASEMLRETLAGNIVLSIGTNLRSDARLFEPFPIAMVEEIKAKLDTLHLRKIDLADEILVLNFRGYVGASTSNEIRYAKSLSKRIRWLEPSTPCPECYADATGLYHVEVPVPTHICLRCTRTFSEVALGRRYTFP